MTFILFNPYSGNGSGLSAMEELRQRLSDKATVPVDITGLADHAEFAKGLTPDDQVIVCGGDGTLSRFADNIAEEDIPCDILYYGAGSGNDFLMDTDHKPGDAPFSVKEYLRDLPVITANGMRRRFINGIGLGLDGYCCAEVAEARKQGKTTSYIAVAIRAFLKDFTPANATVTVDGKTYEYRRAWLVPTMKGRFFGGGVMAAPMQDRRNPGVTLLVMHNVGRLAALVRFPTFMKGDHPKFTKMIAIHRGRQIHVKFDRPTDLQIDGEPYRGVTEYTVEA